MIIKTENESYGLCKNISLIINKDEIDNIDEFYSTSGSYEKVIKKELLNEVTFENIRAELSNVKNLVLELTQNCNLRCKYCTFSKIYNLYRDHQNQTMSFDNIKKAINIFLKQIDSPLRNRREGDAIISFYGGESLLELKNLIKAVKYTENLRLKTKKKNDIEFGLTTNGILLSPKILEILVAHKFKIDISFDGPKDIHDSFRVLKNGKGSWNKVFTNIKNIKKLFPEYYNKNIRFFLTLHPEHNIKKIEEFFVYNNSYFNENNIKINRVNFDGIDKKTKNKWLKSLKQQHKQVHSKLEKDKWFFKKLVSEGIEQLMDEGGVRILSLMSSFTGTCFPGGVSLCVEADGNFKICEKMKGYIKIGNVHDGLDYDAIKKIVLDFRKEMIKRKCWDCNVWYLCGACYAVNEGTGKLEIKKKSV